jgi:IS30 family transposase
MVFGPPPTQIKRGRMSIDEKKKIEAVIAGMKQPTAGKVARRLNRHPATINWYMLTRGHIERKPGHAPKPYMRAGKMIYPYSAEQDARLEQLRAEGKVFSEIAAILTKEFEIERTCHSVQVRLVQLTAAPD